MSFTRGLGALVAGFVLAVAGGLVALDLAEANPSPALVLANARRFVGTATSVRYTAEVTIDVPTATSGERLVRRLHVTGVGKFPGVGEFSGAWDRTSTDGTTALEYRSTPAITGILVRSGPGPAPLDTAKWSRFASIADVDAALAGTVTSPAQAATVADVVLADELANADVPRRILAGAHEPVRRGHGAHDVGIMFDPTSLPAPPASAPATVAIGGELRTAPGGAPQALDINVRDGPATVTVAYVFAAWNGPVDVATPAQADITSP
jgi:hypothetical protein